MQRTARNGSVSSRLANYSTAGLAVAALCSHPGVAGARTLDVLQGESIQAAIESAVDGDLIAVAPGEFNESLDFLGKAIRVIGAGPSSVLRPLVARSVVRIASGEGAGSVLEGFTIRGGAAMRGGGVYIRGASPIVRRNVIIDNRAVSFGSGVHIEESNALLENNLIAFNRSAGGDPHSIEVQNAAPTIVNNTIVRGDSNGLILRGISPAIVMNNIFAWNGSVVDGERRGRGICDFSGGRAQIHYNLFYRNLIGALLTNGTDFRRVAHAEIEIGAPRLLGNVDGPPRFLRVIGRRVERHTADDFALRVRRPGSAVDRGNPAPSYADVDGSRNDLGITGGPLPLLR